jgi:hypothetical protein
VVEKRVEEDCATFELFEERLASMPEEEVDLQYAIQSMGKCEAGYPWDKEEGGWRCQGGSHFLSDSAVKAQADMNKAAGKGRDKSVWKQ